MSGSGGLATPYLSVSRINLWLQCPRRAKYHYIDRLPSATTASSLVFGTAVHAALADLYQARLEGREPTADEIHGTFRAAWTAEPKPIEFRENETAEGLDALARAMLVAVLAAAQQGTILAVEEGFEVELGPGLPRLKGVIDAIELRDGRVVVREHKTAARTWSDDQVQHSLQAAAYVLAASQMGLPGVGDVDDVEVEFQILTKSKRPAIELRSTRRTSQQVEELRDVAAAVVAAERAEIFPRRRDWFCGSCPFRDPCAR